MTAADDLTWIHPMPEGAFNPSKPAPDLEDFRARCTVAEQFVLLAKRGERYVLVPYWLLKVSQ